MKKLFALILLLGATTAQAQPTETLEVVAYNLLNFPSTSPNRIDTLKEICDYLEPDILMVCELNSSVGSDDILFNALNVDGETAYQAAAFVPGPDTENNLYYNGDKLVLVEQNEITTALRDINEYVLYHKATDLATAEDTVFFYIYVVHLKASLGFEAERNAEATVLKNYIATRPNAENIMIGGDFNFYGSSTEPAWNTILNGGGVTIKDPIVTPGEWHADAGFAPVHTQSTRTTSFDGGATGGLDDRFDFIFIGPDLQTWENGARYKTGSYKAIGNDALHYNVALLDPPVNTIVPANVLTALYHMSDHLPVYMEVEVATEAVGIDEMDSSEMFFYNQSKEEINYKVLTAYNQGLARIYDLSGKLLKTFDLSLEWSSFDVSDLNGGTYIFKHEAAGAVLRFVKN